MASRKNFPNRKEARRVRAQERIANREAYTDEEWRQWQLAKLNRAGLRAEKERERLGDPA